MITHYNLLVLSLCIPTATVAMLPKHNITTLQKLYTHARLSHFTPNKAVTKNSTTPRTITWTHNKWIQANKLFKKPWHQCTSHREWLTKIAITPIVSTAKGIAFWGEGAGSAIGCIVVVGGIVTGSIMTAAGVWYIADQSAEALKYQRAKQKPAISTSKHIEDVFDERYCC